MNIPLRIRLHINGETTGLHAYKWETLRDPERGMLCLGDMTWFSRYRSSSSWRQVQTHSSREMKALALIASPSNLAAYNLTPLDLDQEQQRVVAGMRPIPVTCLAGGGRATLENLVAELRAGYDILYIACHGTIREGVNWLWLEREDGTIQRVSAHDLVTRIAELPTLPRLVMLISCRGAGTGHQRAGEENGGALANLLIQTGVPAVIAMQGNITMESMSQFLPVFFNELRKDGQLDRAMARARSRIRERHDWWMPVLLMRLRDGRIFRPGFSDKGDATKWPALVTHIQRSNCTPVLGPNLAQTLFGSRRDLARHWARAHGFPMAHLLHDDLPRVAQYLSIHQDQGFLLANFQEQLLQQLRARFPMVVDPLRGAPLPQIVQAIGAWRREHDPRDPFKILAELPLPVYISAMQDNLLEHALRAAGREPVIEPCRWNRDLMDLPSFLEDEPDYRPTPEKPLIYQLLGTIDDDFTLVLTEDQYLDFMVSVGGNHQIIPPMIRRRLTDSSLMFLGFFLDDWDFRVIFRTIMNHLGGSRRRRYSHVAVQLDAGNERIADPEAAQAYIETYFGQEQIHIFWGDAEDFTGQLEREWQGRSP